MRKDYSSLFGARRGLAVVAGFAWIAALGAGMHRAMRWESQPGAAPSAVGAERAARVWRLLVVAHPDCPCTAASLENLREIVRRSSRPLSVRVLFVSPHPEETATVSAARSIPGAQIEFERRPDPSRDHGALTSGQTFLFDPQGEVRFSGGVTDGRGAPARSSGAAAIASILVGGADAHAPVYGCALFALEAGR